METETTEEEGYELYFPHQMQQTPLTKHSFQKLLRFKISINFATFFLIHKLILRYYNRLKYNIKRQNIMCNDNFNLTVQSHWIMFCFMVTHFLRGGEVLLVSVSKG